MRLIPSHFFIRTPGPPSVGLSSKMSAISAASKAAYVQPAMLTPHQLTIFLQRFGAAFAVPCIPLLRGSHGSEAGANFQKLLVILRRGYSMRGAIDRRLSLSASLDKRIQVSDQEFAPLVF